LPPSSKQKHAGFPKLRQLVSTLKITSYKILTCIVLIIYQCGLKKENGLNPVIYLQYWVTFSGNKLVQHRHINRSRPAYVFAYHTAISACSVLKIRAVRTSWDFST
jgi:hypothetical protein